MDSLHMNEIYKSYSQQCTCKVLTKHFVVSVDYYIIEVVLELPS